MIVKIDKVDDGRRYDVSYSHSDDFSEQLANTGAAVQKAYEHFSRRGSKKAIEAARRCKQAIEGIVIVEDSSVGSVRVFATNPESQQTLLYRYADQFLKRHNAMVYNRAYNDSFHVCVPNGNGGIVTKLTETEFDSYIGLFTEHMVDLMETYQGKPTPRNHAAVVSSAQALRDFFWGYYVDFNMDNVEVPVQDAAEAQIRFARFNLKGANDLVESMGRQDRDAMIREWLQKSFVVPAMAMLYEQAGTN